MNHYLSSPVKKTQHYLSLQLIFNGDIKISLTCFLFLGFNSWINEEKKNHQNYGKRKIL